MAIRPVKAAANDSSTHELRARLGACTLDFTCLGLLDVVGGNPVRVVGVCGTDSGGIGRGGVQVGLLHSGSRPLGFSAAALLGKVWCDPDGVEEVENTSEECEDEEVQEDDLGVKNAGLRLNHTDSSVESLNGEKLGHVLGKNGDKAQAEILRMHISGKTERQGLLLSGWDLDSIGDAGKIADNLGRLSQSGKSSCHEIDRHRLRFLIVECQQSLRGFAVDELDAEDL